MPSTGTLYRHNITDDQYDALLEEQDGRCAVCLVEKAKLVIDHDHQCCGSTKGFSKTCGRCIRGLVCHRCNSLLGYIENAEHDVLIRAVLYIFGKNPRQVGSDAMEAYRLLSELSRYLAKWEPSAVA